MRLGDLVATSRAVAGSAARSAKVAALADLLRRLDPGEVEAAVGMLTGTPRQGRVGIGWRTLAAVDAPAAESPSLDLREVDGAVAAVAACAGPGSAGRRAALLRDLLGRATGDEQAFLRALLTGELRQGALEGVMADAVARAAGVPAASVRRAAMLGGDLARAACLALGPDAAEALASVGLHVGRPVLPMLAASSPAVEDAVADVGLASVEWKLDGARIQVHRDGSDVGIFTRNLNDVTGRLPGIVAGVLAMPARSVVLDGEAIGVEGDRPGAFQDTMSSFGRRHGAAGAALGAWFFDVLHVDGDDLLDEPLTVRQAALDAVVGRHAVPRLVTGDPAAAAAFAEEALALGHEGVMVKAAASTYEAGRRGAAWRKVKPVRTLDLVVLAVEWGSGRRRGWLSNLHLGARQPGGGFVMVGKTFKGLTDDLLRWQTEQLLARKVREEGHVVVVRPELVVEVALDGVQRSTRYPGGVALRFARVRRYRDDRSPADADTIDAVRALLPAAGQAEQPPS